MLWKKVCIVVGLKITSETVKSNKEAEYGWRMNKRE